jgi:hypothetical protein
MGAVFLGVFFFTDDGRFFTGVFEAILVCGARLLLFLFAAVLT